MSIKPLSRQPSVQSQHPSSYNNQQRQVIEVWEPTYRPTPIESQKFVSSKIQSIIEQIVTQQCSTLEYDDIQCKQQSIDLCNLVKESVKKLKLPRYKLILQSVISENKQQGLCVSSKGLWNDTTDNYSTYTHKTNTCTVTVLVFGLYLE